MGLRRSWWMSSVGVPHGLPGRLGVRMMPRISRSFHDAISAELDLQPEDELLDVGCGSATLFVDHAGHVRYVAGLDASELQLEMAHKRLAERIAAGTAEIVHGDADHLPWEDGRFSVATSVNCVFHGFRPHGPRVFVHPDRRPRSGRREGPISAPDGHLLSSLDG